MADGRAEDAYPASIARLSPVTERNLHAVVPSRVLHRVPERCHVDVGRYAYLEFPATSLVDDTAAQSGSQQM
jgi:hypothetical protein